MITPRTRAIVSLAATLTAALALGACARSPARPGPAARADVAAPAARPPAIRFDNGGRERVLVYLVGEQREWLLGRVEPGARATLRLPRASLAGSPGATRARRSRRRRSRSRCRRSSRSGGRSRRGSSPRSGARGRLPREAGRDGRLPLRHAR
jgi:hypothetical protein